MQVKWPINEVIGAQMRLLPWISCICLVKGQTVRACALLRGDNVRWDTWSFSHFTTWKPHRKNVRSGKGSFISWWIIQARRFFFCFFFPDSFHLMSLMSSCNSVNLLSTSVQPTNETFNSIPRKRELWSRWGAAGRWAPRSRSCTFRSPSSWCQCVLFKKPEIRCLG